MPKHANPASRLQFAYRLFVCCLLLYFGAVQAESDYQDSIPVKQLAESSDVSHDPSNESAGEHPDFSGMWLLDKSASDNAEEIMKASLHKRKKSSSFHDGGMDDKQPPAALTVVHLEIFHSDPELRIVADQSGEQTIFTDFRSTSITALGGPQQKVVIAGWESHDLVIETRTTGGSVTVQRLRLLENPRRLERVTEIPSPGPDGESIIIKQIFNPRSR